MDEKKELIQLKINYLTTELTCLWGTAAITLGSSFVFLMNKTTPNDVVIGLVGFCVSIVLFNAFLVKRNGCQNLIKEFEKEVSIK